MGYTCHTCGEYHYGLPLALNEVRFGRRLVGPVTLLIAAAAMSGCITGTIGPACGSTPVPPPGNSLRVLTYNTALFSPIFLCGAALPVGEAPWWNSDCFFFNDLGGPIAEHANAIAALLEDGGFDVLAFNEVWDEDDGKEILADRLCPTFPHFVKYVDVFGGGVEEDSGLMLFSKLEFEPLPNSDYVSEDNESSHGDDSDRIAYVWYEDCEEQFEDCLAAKGAVLVRLKHPSSGRIINVIASHLQANASGNTYDSVRVKQLRQVLGQCETGIPVSPGEFPLLHGTIRDALAQGESLCNWSNRQWLLFMGDLNIPGHLAVGEALFDAENPNQGPDEWWYRIGSKAEGADDEGINDTGYALYDSWAETTSELDKGFSSGDSGRLDYVLASRRTMEWPPTSVPPPDLCIQHVFIPPEFEGLSDHRPVAADLNLEARQCNPRLAEKPTADDMGELDRVDGKEAKKFHRSIEHLGGMQWWRIEEPGTFVVALSEAAATSGVRFEVLRADNLGVPLAGGYDLGEETIQACDYFEIRFARCEPVTGRKFVLPDGPHYVRLFHPNRTFTGNYWIAFYRYTCKSQDDACELLPNVPYRFAFPSGEPLNPDDQAWFRVEVKEQADSGERQTLRFFARKSADSSSWTDPAVVVGAGTSDLSQLDGQMLVPEAMPDDVPEAVVVTGSTASNAVVFLKVARSVQQDLVIQAGWQTNLLLVGGSIVGPKPATLVCENETDIEWGEDEIELRVDVDGTGWQARGGASYDCNEKPFGRNWDQNLGLIRFIDTVQVRPVEEDVNPDDEAGAKPISFPMESEIIAPVRSFLDFEWSGGKYTFNFNLGRWRVR